jgi:tetratricopeptide (TPR) repeat protein
VVDRLSGLVDKSLIVAETIGAAALFRLLDTTRAYALEKLETSGEFDAVARRHAEHYRDLLERIEADWDLQPTELHADHAGRIDDLRAAVEWAFSERGDPSLAVALMVAASPLFMHLSMFDECCARIEQALHASPGLGANDVRSEMKLRIAFAASAARSGAFAASAKAAWERALALARQCDDVDGQRRALHGLWVVDHRNAIDLAQQFLDLANSPLDRAVGRAAMATTLHHRGDHKEAHRLVDDVIAEYESATEPPVTGIVRYQRDEWMVAYATRARILWLQGYPHQAVQAALRSVDRARKTNHSNSVCMAIAMAMGPLVILNGDLERGQQYIDLFKAQMTRHGLSFWRGWAVCYEAMLAIGRGSPSGATDWLRVGSELLLMQKHWRMVPFFFAELALVLGRNRWIDDGLAVVDAAREREDGRWLAPDLLRVKGELLILKNAGGARVDAENCFREAIAEAQRQGALAWQLRAATSLAKLLQSHGRMIEGEALLRPVYEQFTEGFDTPDLRTARTLLDSHSKAHRQ